MLRKAPYQLYFVDEDGEICVYASLYNAHLSYSEHLFWKAILSDVERFHCMTFKMWCFARKRITANRKILLRSSMYIPYHLFGYRKHRYAPWDSSVTIERIWFFYIWFWIQNFIISSYKQFLAHKIIS